MAVEGSAEIAPLRRRYRGVDDGTRTHDRLDHNQELYQLSYVHRERPNLATANAISEPGTLAERPRHDSNVRPAD